MKEDWEDWGEWIEDKTGAWFRNRKCKDATGKLCRGKKRQCKRRSGWKKWLRGFGFGWGKHGSHDGGEGWHKGWGKKGSHDGSGELGIAPGNLEDPTSWSIDEDSKGWMLYIML